MVSIKFNAEAAKYLDDVDARYFFYLTSGQYLKNVKELSSALENMSDHVFNFHVNSQKNDFYNWVKDVIKDDQLAGSIKDVRQRVAMAKKINQRISKIERVKVGKKK